MLVSRPWCSVINHGGARKQEKSNSYSCDLRNLLADRPSGHVNLKKDKTVIVHDTVRKFASGINDTGGGP
jgi:hypothetical protein